MKRKFIILKVRFYSDTKDEKVKTIVGDTKLAFYGEYINVPKGTKSVSIRIYEDIGGD